MHSFDIASIKKASSPYNKYIGEYSLFFILETTVPKFAFSFAIIFMGRKYYLFAILKPSSNAFILASTISSLFFLKRIFMFFLISSIGIPKNGTTAPRITIFEERAELRFFAIVSASIAILFGRAFILFIISSSSG